MSIKSNREAGDAQSDDSIFAKRSLKRGAESRWERGALTRLPRRTFRRSAPSLCDVQTNFPAESRHVAAALSALHRLRGSGTLIPDTGTLNTWTLNSTHVGLRRMRVRTRRDK